MNRMLNRRCLFTAILLAATLAGAQDWPQWRGPNRDGHAAKTVLPTAWPAQLKTVWKTEVGVGHSSPIAAGGKIYAFARQDENEVVLCLDPKTGKVLWRDAYPTPYEMNSAARSHGKGPKSTPVAVGGRLYTLGISGILSAYDLASGKPAWRKEFGGQFKNTSPLYGTAMSPVVDRGLLIAHVGGHDGGALTAFDAQTGAVKWAWKGDGPGYASPLVAILGGVRQIITQTQQQIVSVDAGTGKLLWSLPYTTDYVQNIVTPVVYRDTVIFSGLNNGTFAVRPVLKGGQWTPEKVWENRDVSMYMNSPIVSGDLLFGLSHRRRGQYFCLEASSGKLLWATEGREGENAAIVEAGGLLFLLDNEAELVIAKASREKFDEVRRYTVASSPTWAHAVVLGARMLVKDEKSIALLSAE